MNVLLAKEWNPTIDPTGWWMSEKLDGVRAYWTGSEFVSRNGNQFHAPNWFTEGLPEDALDGELFLERGKFQETVSIVRSHDARDRWARIHYVVFDAPEVPGTFEDRTSAAEHLLQRHYQSSVIGLDRCKGVYDLKAYLAEIEKHGGEGVMLRQPGSLYERKRSNTLLKVKTFHDAEAFVIGHEPGKGKHKGRLGALICAFNGSEFGIGTGFTDHERENPPAVGSCVTFSYQNLTNDGVPRFPSYVRSSVTL